jgi:hypothetical protein
LKSVSDSPSLTINGRNSLMEATMTKESRMLAGLLLVILPSVLYGGLTLLTGLRYWLNLIRPNAPQVKPATRLESIQGKLGQHGLWPASHWPTYKAGKIARFLATRFEPRAREYAGPLAMVALLGIVWQFNGSAIAS